MFSATKFVVAGAIVALFGGFLLAGVLTQRPSDEMTPGVEVASPEASASASPSSTIGLVTEEVKHGVYRVLDDGAGHDLTSTAASDAPREIAVGNDGSVWLHVGTESEGRLFRLGDAADHAIPSRPGRARITAAPDGSVWMLGGLLDEAWLGDRVIRLLDGEWSEFAAPPGRIACVNSVWQLAHISELCTCGASVGRKPVAERMIPTPPESGANGP